MAALNVVWDGSTDNEPTTDANWSSAAEPDADDTCIIPAYADEDSDGTTILGSAAFPSETDVLDMIIEEGGAYTIGTRALPLTIKFADLTTSDLNIGGTGTYFLTPVNYDTITITEAGSAPASGQYAVNLTAMTHAEQFGVGEIHVNCEENMSVGIGAENGVATKVALVKVTGGEVKLGSGCVALDGAAAVNLTITGGDVVTDCALATVTMTGGTLTVLSGAVTTLTMRGGTCSYLSDGTLGTLSVSESGTFDATGNTSSFTVTNPVELYSGATFLDPDTVATNAIVFDLNQCSLDDVTLDIGGNKRITRGTVA